MAKVKVETLVESVGSCVVFAADGSVNKDATKEAWYASVDKTEAERVLSTTNKIREESIESKLLFKDLLAAHMETTAKWDGMIGEAVLSAFELYAGANTVPASVPSLVGVVSETLRRNGQIKITEIIEANKQVARWLRTRNGSVVSYGPGKAGVKLL
jgi:hypothetical protein